LVVVAAVAAAATVAAVLLLFVTVTVVVVAYRFCCYGNTVGRNLWYSIHKTSTSYCNGEFYDSFIQKSFYSQQRRV
jgi:DMSO reductase anchor subunit